MKAILVVALVGAALLPLAAEAGAPCKANPKAD
jgi:hypothetical protein